MKKMQIVEEARQFGYCYLGEDSFNVIKDAKSWMRFLKKNDLDCEFGITHREDGWYLISFPY